MSDHDREGNVTWKPSPESDAPLLEDRVENDGGDGSGAGGTAVASRGPMQQLLAHYCDALQQMLQPLLAPLAHATEVLTASGELPVQTLLPGLRELRTQTAQLVDKVAEQQAYVLIFGPLKSGKSTLMNAICTKYVSEVTSLPAYPCLVQVAHADQTRYQVTHYNSDVETYSDQALLHEALEASHRELVATIRRVEAGGEEFEPHRHAPFAIARIEIRAPAGDLAHSGAVLVDTPGLYTRMKFGYDRMTRDFRDAAACAIFVVKTDNLFLDQVFDEFEELLELFSRIFLIVNLDASKRDLQPDGSLRPSIEHEDPQAVVRAFENLSMSAAVKAAREDGRLRIYPVDLLGAASRRIQASQAAARAAEEAPHGQADFDLLLNDFTDYLNSNEYLRGFVGDSLRRARSLLGDLLRLLDERTVGHLETRVARLAGEESELTERQSALDRLRGMDWAQQFETQRQPLQDVVQARLESISRNTSHGLNGAIDAWFETDASLVALLRNDIEPTLARCREDCVRRVREELDALLVRAATVDAMPADLRRAFDAAVIDPTQTARSALGTLRVGDHLSMPAPTLGSTFIPVRRTLLDWLLLRSTARVRERLFGPASDPDQSIAADTKARRLGERAREAMRTQLQSTLVPFAERAARQLPKESFDAYLDAWNAQLARALDETETATRTRLETVTALRDDARGVLDALLALKAITGPALQASTQLHERFSASDAGAIPEMTPQEAGDSTPVEP
jgi:GTPase SAR1 family protein